MTTPNDNATEDLIRLGESRSAHNYHPLPVVISSAEGAWVTDVEGRRYLDCLAGYSSLNFGHGNPAIIAAAREQLGRLTLTSRAFFHDQFAAFVSGLADLCGKDMVLPMNTGAEAVETAIKVARKWGYEVKGVPGDRANIVVMEDNFHGRTTTIVSFSTDPDAHDGFGPYTPGFRIVKYGSAEAIRDAIDEDTVAVLLEPIQGEAGVLVPPDGYLTSVREICSESGVLFIADEIQSGLGRTGETFACDHEGVVPDMYVLGKALGGGVVPVSAVAANADVLGVIKPGQHGSTFGGNPLACAVGNAVIALLRTGEYQARARELGAFLHERLRELSEAREGRPGIVAVRGRGLWAGIDIDPSLGTGRQVSEALMRRGVLAKDTHGSTIRLAPPIVVSRDDLAWAVDQLAAVLTELAAG
ncbi:ornithine--oxo-acid transaminase [Planotetraspora sp. GP83]|uniref:ornithine--oxo-acid transaminase n=1 Tax=Planotetraspora sp. GP83 TaxID=3156264 RepID=UPI003512D3B3